MTEETGKNKFIEIFNSIDFNRITDHPNILIAAGFWDEERYCAAKTCYRLMRQIDDLIDNYKAENRSIPQGERKDFIADVEQWIKLIRISEKCGNDDTELAGVIEKFRIPLWPLESFARSMIYDINYDGFPTLDSFIEYSMGASVAPASIFVHLSGLRQNDGIYSPPEFDVREAALPCAMFSYFVHIIRDFQKDQFNNLNYFADDAVNRHGLTRTTLNRIAHGAPIPSGFRNMIRELLVIADNYRKQTLDVIDRISPMMEPRYRLSLRIIFDLYLMVFERIDAEKSNFTSEELNPTPEQTRLRVYETILKFS